MNSIFEFFYHQKMSEVLISSIYRTSGASENFQANIPSGTEIKLLEASIPASFNNVPSGSFIVVGTTSGSSTINFSTGRYTQTTFATALQTIINTAKAGQTYTIVVNGNNSFTISATETFHLDMTGSALAPWLGITGVTSTAASVSGAATLSYFNPSHMLICSADVVGVDNGVIFSPVPYSIIHAVPLCPSGTINYRSDHHAPWVKLVYLFNPNYVDQPTTLNLNLKLSTGLAVNMNGDNWTIKILVR